MCSQSRLSGRYENNISVLHESSIDHIPLVEYNIAQVEYGRNENAETWHIRIVEL